MINVNKFKPGITFMDNDEIFIVLTTKHSKQARGQASVKAKVKNLKTGAITVKTYTGGQKLSDAFIEKKQMDYLYSDQNDFYFMDSGTYEQISIKSTLLEWEKNFLREGQPVAVRFYQDEILDIELPKNITLKVIEAPDAIKGNTQNNPQKKVKLESGYVLEVPMFIKEGDLIIVSTETGSYSSRTK